MGGGWEGTRGGTKEGWEGTQRGRKKDSYLGSLVAWIVWEEYKQQLSGEREEFSRPDRGPKPIIRRLKLLE